VAIMMDLQWSYKRHAAIFAGTQEYALEHGWECIIDEFAHVTLARAKGALHYDGVIARASTALANRAARRGVPLVNVWGSSPVRHRVPGVYPDSTAVGRLFAEHLLSRGFRCFATLTAPKNVEHELEVREFARLTRAAGFDCVAAQIPQNPWRDLANWRKSERLVERWLDALTPPVGVYVGLEACGRMVVQACRRRGWQVPRDIAIISGKNEETLCEHPHPTLTSVEIGYERIGHAAAHLLDTLMNGVTPPVEALEIAPLGLVVRESTDFFAVDSELVAAALAFIAAHCHQRIGPDEVARAVNAETRTLQNHFRKVLQRPVAAEIRRVRLERAKRELAQSRRPIAEIAAAAGFGTLQRLYEVFQREVGVSPREYRQQRQLQPAPRFHAASPHGGIAELPSGRPAAERAPAPR
jgi:LacI family transcriptional regulator